MSDSNWTPVELAIKDWYAQSTIAREVLNSEVGVFAVLEDLSKALIRLRSRVASEVIAFYKFPLDWREALKERFAPSWFKKRWPIRYHQINVEVHYPKVSLPLHEHYIHIEYRFDEPEE